MHIRQPTFERTPSIRTYLQKSGSATLIFGERSGHEYAESIMSFKKDFATIDSQQRHKQSLRKSQSIEKTKQSNLHRQIKAQQNQQKKDYKLSQRQKRAQNGYKSGDIKSTLANSLPINPLNCEYQSNKYGKSLAQMDSLKDLNRVVRSHYLQTIGNSGYNIISGRSPMTLQTMVPPEKMKDFETKLNKLYSQFKINPQNN